ncbi:MAG: transporter substrate-binding domain-containing protein, partial [Anaerolineae bacterium]|nr:transporter substrate-binding domain-containing protein [Anaerolineae bacterium]
MKRFFFGIIGLMLVFSAPLVFSQDEPIPTLIPPTLVPTPQVAGDDGLPSQSAVTRIQERGVLRVGILYNEPPYGELTIRGEVAGYDADVARALADAWGVEIEFVQVTRQNRIEMLRSGEVDLLLAAMIHERELDPFVEFSQTYRVGHQSVMVGADDESPLLINLANKRIGYVVATPAEVAINAWQQRSGIPLQLQSYLTLDEAYSALFADQVDAVVAREERLLRVAAAAPDAIRILDEPVAEEPYAIALLRQDVPLRNLVNQTL